MAEPSHSHGEAANSKTIDLSGMTFTDATEDAPVVLDLELEEDIAANLDHFILLSRQGFFEEADAFFEACLKKHASWFAIVWEYYNCKTIKDRHFRPSSDEFLHWASRSYTYNPEETALLDLIISGFVARDDYHSLLYTLLRTESLRDYEIMTILTLVRMLNHSQNRTRYISIIVTAPGTALELYINSLTEAGYFWDAYATVIADDYYLLESPTRIRCLERILETITHRGFLPAQYGLDDLAVKLLQLDILVATGTAHFLTLECAWFSKATVGREKTAELVWQTSSEKLWILMHSLEESVSKLSSRLMKTGAVWDWPKQQLDYDYMTVLARMVSPTTFEMRSELGDQDLRDLHDRASSANYSELAQDIRCILNSLTSHTEVATSYNRSFRASYSTSAIRHDVTRPSSLEEDRDELAPKRSTAPAGHTDVQKPRFGSSGSKKHFSEEGRKAASQVEATWSLQSSEVYTPNNQQYHDNREPIASSSKGSAGSETVDPERIDEDVSATLHLVLEEDIAANLDHYIRLSRQGYFKDADLFFDKHLGKHAGWFPIVWEHFDCQLIANNHDPNKAKFLQEARRAYTYTEKETDLIELMLESTFQTTVVQDGDAALKQLRDRLAIAEKDDFDIMTITILMSILHESEKPSASFTDLDAQIRLYANDLTDAGFFWEAYTVIDGASDLITSASRKNCFSHLWDALNVPGLQPADYGQDSEMIQLLKVNILTKSCAQLCLAALCDNISQTGKWESDKLDDQIESIQKMTDALLRLHTTVNPKQKFEYELFQVLLYAIEFDTAPDRLQMCFEQLKERADLIGYNAMSDFLTTCIKWPEEIFERRLHTSYQPRKGLPAEPFPTGHVSLEAILHRRNTQPNYENQKPAYFGRDMYDSSANSLDPIAIDPSGYIEASPASRNVDTENYTSIEDGEQEEKPILSRFTQGKPNIAYKDNMLLQTKFHPKDTKSLPETPLFHPDQVGQGTYTASKLEIRRYVPCRNCRRRKVRCQPSEARPGAACHNCVRLGKDCIPPPVLEAPPVLEEPDPDSGSTVAKSLQAEIQARSRITKYDEAGTRPARRSSPSRRSLSQERSRGHEQGSSRPGRARRSRDRGWNYDEEVVVSRHKRPNFLNF